MTEIREIVIDVKQRTLSCFTEEGKVVNFPLTPDGSHIIKWTKVSAGGLTIQSLLRQLEDFKQMGGRSV